MKIVIVGASFAGLSAALECLHRYPEADITLIDREKEVGYFPNVFNWKLKGDLKDWREAQVDSWQQVYDSAIHLQLETDVIAIDSVNQVVKTVNKGKRSATSYDYLILALGARQVWERANQDLEHYLLSSKTLEAAKASLAKIENATSIAVIGGGQIGLESLDALSQLPISLHLFEAQAFPLAKYFDKEMAYVIEEELKHRGVQLHLSETVNQLGHAANGVRIDTLKQQYHVDYCVVATNFKPNSSLLEGVVELYSDGAVKVNDFLQTSNSRIFAIGDLIRLPFAFFGEAYLPTISHAILTGQLVAYNLVKPTIPLHQVQRIVSSHIFGYNVTSVGLTEQEANLWMDTQSIRLQTTVSQWEQDKVDFKLVLEKGTGRLLGGQLVTCSDCNAQMNTLALAISKQMTAWDLMQGSWLSLPKQTAVVPLLVQAARKYVRQQQESKK